MKIRIELDPQVVAFVRSLAPEPRRQLRQALRGLETERGDIKQLEADRAGYARLRMGTYRIIVRFYRRGWTEGGPLCFRRETLRGLRVVRGNLARSVRRKSGIDLRHWPARGTGSIKDDNEIHWLHDCTGQSLAVNGY